MEKKAQLLADREEKKALAATKIEAAISKDSEAEKKEAQGLAKEARLLAIAIEQKASAKAAPRAPAAGAGGHTVIGRTVPPVGPRPAAGPAKGHRKPAAAAPQAAYKK